MLPNRSAPIYIPYIIGHLGLFLVVVPLSAFLLYIPSRTLSGLLPSASADAVLFLFSGVLAGSISRLAFRRGYESVFLLALPVWHWVSWMLRLSTSIGVASALGEGVKSFYTLGCCVDSAVALYLEPSTIGYVIGGLAIGGGNEGAVQELPNDNVDVQTES